MSSSNPNFHVDEHTSCAKAIEIYGDEFLDSELVDQYSAMFFADEVDENEEHVHTRDTDIYHDEVKIDEYSGSFSLCENADEKESDDESHLKSTSIAKSTEHASTAAHSQ